MEVPTLAEGRRDLVREEMQSNWWQGFEVIDASCLDEKTVERQNGENSVRNCQRRRKDSLIVGTEGPGRRFPNHPLSLSLILLDSFLAIDTNASGAYSRVVPIGLPHLLQNHLESRKVGRE